MGPAVLLETVGRAFSAPHGRTCFRWSSDHPTKKVVSVKLKNPHKWNFFGLAASAYNSKWFRIGLYFLYQRPRLRVDFLTQEGRGVKLGILSKFMNGYNGQGTYFLHITLVRGSTARNVLVAPPPVPRPSGLALPTPKGYRFVEKYKDPAYKVKILF